MAGFVKGIVRFGVVGVIVGGGAAFLAETVRPGSVGAILHKAGHVAGNVIDQNIDDPIALRAQLRSLEASYPQKIAEVRDDLTEADDQIAMLEREMTVSEKVVALTDQDLSVLDQNIETARSAEARGGVRFAKVSFNDTAMTLDTAYAKRQEIQAVRGVHAQNAAQYSTELGYLQTQRGQLSDLLARLEREQTEFQVQLKQLDAQIDAIARNDRMISTLKDRQRTIDEHSRYRADSLDQIQDRLAKIRQEQQGALAAIQSVDTRTDYVDEAEYLIDREAELEVAPTRALPTSTEEADHTIAHN